MSEEKVIIDAEWLATEVAGIIYDQSKARIFNVLESQLDQGSKLNATKKITQDIITEVTRNAANLIRDVLRDWQDEVEPGPEVDLTPDELDELKQNYQEIEETTR